MKLGSHMTNVQRAKISVAMTGRHPSDETKAKLSAALRGHAMPESVREVLHCINLGSHQSAEIRAKHSAVQMGHRVHDGARAKISMAARQRIGPMSGNWKGGITPENKRIRDSEDYAAWRTAVFQRDDYTCQDCGQHSGDLEAHHVHEFAKYPDERFVVDNGKTLCLECHNKTQRGGRVTSISNP